MTAPYSPGPVGSVPSGLRATVKPTISDDAMVAPGRVVSEPIAARTSLSVLDVMRQRPYGTSVSDALSDGGDFGPAGGGFASVDVNPNPEPPGAFSANWSALRRDLDALGKDPSVDDMVKVLLAWISKKLKEVKTKLDDKNFPQVENPTDSRELKAKYLKENETSVTIALNNLMALCAQQGKATVLACASDLLWLFFRFASCAVGWNRFIASISALRGTYDPK